MKRFLPLLLALSMILGMLSLASCGGNTGGGTGPVGYQLPEGATFDTSKPVTIRFYSTMGKNLIEAIEPFIAEFQTMYPNITVEHTQPGGYDEVRDTIKTEITVNEQPNIAYCYPDHVAMSYAFPISTIRSFPFGVLETTTTLNSNRFWTLCVRL